LQLNDIGVLFTFLPYDTRDLQIQKYLASIGSNGVYYARRSSNVELALDLLSLKVKDTAVGTALHEFAESYFPPVSRVPLAPSRSLSTATADICDSRPRPKLGLRVQQRPELGFLWRISGMGSP
jgi:hypothetical protein